MERHNKSSKNNATVKNESVQVVIRCRPMNKKETNENASVVDVYPNRGVIEIYTNESSKENSKKTFTYDAVYDANSTQQDIYDEIVRPLVSSVLEGFNGCVFAYGQTGTGKTHTMEGVRGDPMQRGVVPRTFEQIWSHINRAQNTNFLVAVSYLEIYMEELRDLLKPNLHAALEIRERENGVFVTNIHSVLCKSADDMINVMNQGNRNRTVGFTNMNEHSSRSHAIFMITIEMCEGETNTIKVGKLNLIDLAGSERQSKTGAKMQRLKEASKINRALSSLGNVISSLADNSPHVPYRDSKLTRLLQDSLGGNSKTIMIANIGPSEYNYSETLTTLRYAHRAKTIQNKPIKNEDPQDAKLKEYQEEISRLRALIEERQTKEKPVPKRKKTAKSKGRKENMGVEKSDSEAEEEKESDRNSMEIDLETKEQLQKEKEVTQELALKLKEIENQLVRGGRNILDTYTERQVELEKKLGEIAERKKREVEMQQQLELQEENTTEIKETVTSLQQEVELKTRKLKKCYAKYMALKQDLVDTRDEHNRDRRELEMTQNELIKELKRHLLIIDNFVPEEVKSRLYTQARYDEEQEEWNLFPNMHDNQANRRPISVPTHRRPLSEFAAKQIKQSGKETIRFKGENIINYELDMPLRTTFVYKNPKVSASVKAVLAEAMQTENDLDIEERGSNTNEIKNRLDRIINRNVQQNSNNDRARSSKPDHTSDTASAHSRSVSAKRSASAFPKTRGLVRK